jgi:hypothetical protein
LKIEIIRFSILSRIAATLNLIDATMIVDRAGVFVAVLVHFTERHLIKKSVGRTPFDRKFMKGHLTDFFLEKGRLTETTFDKKCHLTEKS